MTDSSFKQKLDAKALAYFEEVCNKSFSQQAVHFLNAYWAEVGDQAEFIFSVAYDRVRMADMHSKGVQYIHLYDEGNDLDFNFGLYFYEKLCKFLGESKNSEWTDEKWAKSQPEMITAIVRKRELREKVDVNFDGRIGFLEYLLYQYRAFANPADFTTRSMKGPEEHPEIRKARLALEAVNARIKAYEAEKMRLENESKHSGVRGLKAKNLLAQLHCSPLWEQLNKALITAEAAVRAAARKFGKGGTSADGQGSALPTDGAIWWLKRDLAEKKKKYGPRSK